MNISNNDISGLIDELELDPSAVYADYSGRAMYGATCFGLVIPRRITPVHVGAAIVRIISNDDLIEEMLNSVETDSMGLDTIVYFTDVEAQDWEDES